MKNNIQSLFITLGLILLASLIYTLGTSMIIVSSHTNLQLSYLAALISFMPLGFMILPYYISSKNNLYSNNNDVCFNWKSYIVIAGSIFFINHYFLGSDEYFHQMIISMCEEFLFRFIIYKILKSNYSYATSILITALLFGVVLHLNYPILDNLFIRTPLGILFSILATKFGLEYAIGSHWIYNLYQSII
ncbi:lysostaphin resistance A-like protein [Streptococcus pluranimalium]|uniref:CPBP family intramembrane glutamic endopeptidase n=1 Tax=Streptococcus pluranimalium TaxID=82348 RepID=UPI003F67E681